MASIIVCIDPGHGKDYNRGAYNLYYEGNKMYELGTLLKKELEKYIGITAYITRNSVTDDPTLTARGEMAKTKKACLFISLHTNACDTESVNRVEVYRSVKLPNSEALGWNFMNAIVETMGADVTTKADSCIKTRYNSAGDADYYGVIRHSAGGSVTASFILEHGFHTNYDQCEWLYSTSNLTKLAKAEAKVIANYYGCTTKSITSVSSVTSNKTQVEGEYTNYKVQKKDTWWSIAKTKMGDGLLSDELAAYNNRTTTSVLKAGETIKIPKASSKYENYTVVKGDTWWSIASKKLGKGSRYKELAAYNETTVDKKLTIGTVIKIPVEE